MAQEAKSPKDIAAAHVPQEPAPAPGPSEDVKANQAAKVDAKVDDENPPEPAGPSEDEDVKAEDAEVHDDENPREPAGPSEDEDEDEDVKANELAATKQDAKVHQEKVAHFQKQDELETEVKVDVKDKVESSSPPKKGDEKEAANDNGKAEDMMPGDASDNTQGRGGESLPYITSEKGDSSSHGERDESDPFSDLKENEKKALEEFRSKIEEAILMNKLFKKQQREQKEESDQKVKSKEDESKKSEMEDQKEKKSEEEEGSVGKGKEKVVDEEYCDDKKDAVDNGESFCLWGVPLMPSRGDKGTDVVLLKFLRARDFKANDALEMLRSTLQWRKENKIDSILEEDFGSDYEAMASMNGVDRRGHPVCYNVYGVFSNDDLYNRTFGKQESREKFLRWRLQLMERQIQKLDLGRPEQGVSSLLQINDLKDTPGPSRKDLRVATRQAVALLQDNYPEFVARNIFINVPFWYYAFNAILSPFLTQRTKSKFVFARTNRVTETLLKYIAGEEIPVKYGGLKLENDPDFSTDDSVSEITVKAGSTETIEIPAPTAGSTFTWDLTAIGWEVNYKEEFVPLDESSYTIIVKKARRIGWQEGSVRNSFRNNEPGKIVLTIENGQFKRKRVLYRSKTKDA